MRRLDLAEQTGLRWMKAWASQGYSMCVEVAAHDRGVAVRHSRTPELGALVYSRDEFAAFLHGAKRGEFDHLVQAPDDGRLRRVLNRVRTRVRGRRRPAFTLAA